MIEKQDKQKGGLGLINLRKRLDLIYPENHKLIINEAGNVFTALLEISLNVQAEG